MTQKTRVDLGDDLLSAETRQIGLESTKPLELEVADDSGATQAFERVKDARILINEGLLPAAKKKLREALLLDERSAEAKALLRQISEAEGLAPEPNSPEAGAITDLSTPEQTRDALCADLGIELDAPAVALQVNAAASEPLDFAARRDLGIAFLEMGLGEEAARHLALALREVEAENEALAAQAATLLARAHLENQAPAEAARVLEPFVRSASLPHDAKAEVFFRLGQAARQLGNPAQADVWHAEAIRIDALYLELGRRPLRKKGR